MNDSPLLVGLAPAGRRLVAGTAVALTLLLLAVKTAGAGATYMIAFNNGNASLPEVYSSTGFRRDTSFALSGLGTGVFAGGAYAGPGYVAASARVDCTWGGIFSGGFWGASRASMTTNDFIITGPAGPSTVPGSIQLRARFALAKTGGSTNNNAHNARFQLNASTLYSGAFGSVTLGNFNLSSSGCFTGVSSPNVDMVVPLTGNYPVNTFFSMTVYVEAAPSAYGNVNDNPGMASSDGGGIPGDANQGGIRLVSGGPVMTLPAGYTLNSASWGVVDNIWQNVVAVEDPPLDESVGLALMGSNPAAGTTRLRLTLPRGSDVAVVVYDVTGRAIATLLSGRQVAGTHDIAWNGREKSGAAAPSGLYFVRAESDRWRVVRRLVRLEH